MGASHVVGLVGVYHADGGPIGEARYLIGKVLGRAHCSLCDVTHSPVRRKPQWDAMAARLGVPVVLLHRNETPADVSRLVAEHGSPIVLARTGDGGLHVVCVDSQIEQFGGSVAAFETAVGGFLARHAAPPPPNPPARARNG